MKKLLVNKLNLIPLAALIFDIVGILLTAVNIGIPGLVITGVGFFTSITSKVLSKKLKLNEIFTYIIFLASILALIIAGIVFGVYTVLDLVNGKDIG